MAVQADGKMLMGGLFTAWAGQTRNYIARLNADGSLDTGFNPGASDQCVCVAVQADGKILVGGDFATLGGQTRNYLARLNADGTLDTGFNPTGTASRSDQLAVQADGKILVGGSFTSVGGQTRNHIGRLNADGSWTRQSKRGGAGRWKGFYWGRLHRPGANGPATQTLTVPDTTQHAMAARRDGSGTWAGDLQLNTNGGTNWTSLGNGTRINGGWGSAAGLSLQTAA